MLTTVRTPKVTLIGNHDDRHIDLAAFPDAEKDEQGFVQTVRDTDAGRLVFLDTAETGYANGHFCASRQGPSCRPLFGTDVGRRGIERAVTSW